MTFKVGYQGKPGSYSEAAAQALVSGLEQPCELVPLVTSANVAEALRTGAISHGIAAIENSTAGVVEETRLALPESAFTRLAFHTLPIRHCLFLKDVSTDPSKVTLVTSHGQALQQCGRYIAAHFPNARVMPAADTALAAENLSMGEYGPDTAVICSRRAGISRGLYLLDEGVQDNPDNATTFAMFCLRDQIAAK